MTDKEQKNFYRSDSKKYNINKNKEFRNWINDMLNNKNYIFLHYLDDVQDLIDKLAEWYEDKYTDEVVIAQKDRNLNTMQTIFDVIDITYFLHSLNFNERDLIETKYSNGEYFSIDQIKDRTSNRDFEGVLFTRVNLYYNKDKKKKGKKVPLPVYINSDNGMVLSELNPKIKKITTKTELTAEELLVEAQRSGCSCNELKECIFNHKCDLELRDRILQLAALKIIYSKDTIPEIGYLRAKMFLEDVMIYFKLELSTKEIEYIMSKDYSKREHKILSKLKK